MNKSVYKISFSGMMFALVLLFQFLEKFMPFGDFGFVKFNISLAFVLVTAVHIGYLWGFGLLALRFVFGPLLSGNGYAPSSVIGQVILFITGTLVLIMFFIFRKRNVRLHKWDRIVHLSVTVLAVSVTMAVLNMLVFVPWYFGTFTVDPWKSVGLAEAGRLYNDGLKVFYFGIPNYYGGVASVYLVFNIINLVIIMLVTFPLLRVSKILRRE